MYTVIRFLAEESGEALLPTLKARLQGVSPGESGELHPGPPPRFSVSLSRARTWEEHLAALLSFLARGAEVIATARASGIRVHMDTAVEPGDYQGRMLTCFPVPLEHLRALSDQGVSFELSFYAGRARRRGAKTRKA
ncbi:MAG: hypothetical protein HYZ53_04770 [Planctomycetes bacterium]|nr:hypothetical protein [Planctomycetota bacterium]